MRWSDSETTKFVELYRDLECLWDIHTPDYRDNGKRLAAYETMVRKMDQADFTVAEAKKKIKNLRNTFNQEIAKIEASKKSGGEIYTPKIRWFAIADCFMRRTVEKRATQSTQKCSPFTLKKEITEREGETSERRESRALSPDLSSSKSTAKKRRSELMTAVRELKEVKKCLQNTEEDEFDAFGRIVALSLRKLPLPLALSAQNEIQAKLGKYRLRVFNRTESTAEPDDFQF